MCEISCVKPYASAGLIWLTMILYECFTHKNNHILTLSVENACAYF